MCLYVRPHYRKLNNYTLRLNDNKNKYIQNYKFMYSSDFLDTLIHTFTQDRKGEREKRIEGDLVSHG